jgi:hypothetical protein
MTRTTKILIGVLLLVAAAYGVHVFRYKLTVSLPDYPPIEKAVWLEQNWSVKNRDWFHHANQGTLTFSILYEWFVALSSRTRIAPACLATPPIWTATVHSKQHETEHDKANVLPVGFARGKPMPRTEREPNPQTKQPMIAVADRAAAFHTYSSNTTELRDGGSGSCGPGNPTWRGSGYRSCSPAAAIPV